eukprot:TRINITY_DN5017_c1_g1_i2.p1 TRINITY_DN5017_c1_g1~~TRINITY_DN5017_c1_g1_i2.p1  ORF type:complete len:157 (-),score=30.09 TRINITY_DN5017_c1_g1_i2:27-497(-)
MKFLYLAILISIFFTILNLSHAQNINCGQFTNQVDCINTTLIGERASNSTCTCCAWCGKDTTTGVCIYPYYSGIATCPAKDDKNFKDWGCATSYNLGNGNSFTVKQVGCGCLPNPSPNASCSNWFGPTTTSSPSSIISINMILFPILIILFISQLI